MTAGTALCPTPIPVGATPALLDKARAPGLSNNDLDAIADRDRTDSSRSVAPLRPAADAVIIDNSKLSLDQVVARIRQLIRQL